MALFTPHPFNKFPEELPARFLMEQKSLLLCDEQLNTTIVPFVPEFEGTVLKVLRFHLAASGMAAQSMFAAQKVVLTGISEQGYASGSLYQKPDASTLLFLQIRIAGFLTPLTGNAKISLLKESLNRYETLWGNPLFSWDSLPEMAKKHYPLEVSAWEITNPIVEFLPRLSQQRPPVDREMVKQSVSRNELHQLLRFWDKV